MLALLLVKSVSTLIVRVIYSLQNDAYLFSILISIVLTNILTNIINNKYKNEIIQDVDYLQNINYREYYNDIRMKELFGTYLYYRLLNIDSLLAPKVTGMLIELDNNTLLSLVNNDELLKEKYNEAIKVLQEVNYVI
jgi:hypothetical protein